MSSADAYADVVPEGRVADMKISCFADHCNEAGGKSFLLLFTRGLTLMWAALSFEKLEEAVTLLAKANRIMELENEILQDKLSKENPDLLKGNPDRGQVHLPPLS